MIEKERKINAQAALKGFAFSLLPAQHVSFYVFVSKLNFHSLIIP
jgi:hypothetical protein